MHPLFPSRIRIHLPYLKGWDGALEFDTPTKSGYYGVMKHANISQIRDHLSEYLRTVRKGETVIVYDRATPVARLEPVPAADRDAPPSYRRALAAGIVIPPRTVDDAIQKLAPPPKSKRSVRLVDALVEERRAGR